MWERARSSDGHLRELEALRSLLVFPRIAPRTSSRVAERSATVETLESDNSGFHPSVCWAAAVTATDAPAPDATGSGAPPFDFATHRQKALDAYQAVSGVYADLARAVYSILRTCLDGGDIKVHSIEHRAKDAESFGNKAAAVDPDDPELPKYPAPLTDITDLAGVRVITFFTSTETHVDAIIGREFEVIEKTDRSALLEEEERLGYHSVHYLVRMKPSRFALPEYARFKDLVAEIQVRTILQHAWAEIEHDIQYKAVSTLPAEIRRRFMTLAGLLEIADREFQALEDEDKRLKEEARQSVALGRLEGVEITPDALQSYLDQKYSPDGRMSEFSYQWEARVLRRLGFEDLHQLDAAISPYDDDAVSRAIWGSRQGQIRRLEDVLTAAFGEELLRRHPWRGLHWFRESIPAQLATLRDAGIPVGTYKPRDAEASRQPASNGGDPAGGVPS
jgi:ppGpp synthetase/RelA/SpoT-type nucleotidyltranferase